MIYNPIAPEKGNWTVTLPNLRTLAIDKGLSIYILDFIAKAINFAKIPK